MAESFFRAFIGFYAFRGDSSVRTWLFSIAKHVFFQHIKRKGINAHIQNTLLYQMCTRSEIIQSDVSDNTLLLELVSRLLDQKDERSRIVFRMRLDGYSFKEIGERVGISESSARVLEHRVRIYLQKELRKAGYGDGKNKTYVDMCNVTCDIIRDLMPLAVDGVASEDSNAAISNHIGHCRECRELFEEFKSHKLNENQPMPDDKKILSYIRRHTIFFIGFVAVLGAAAGIMMIYTPLTFQNLLIMPIVGAFSYCCFKNKGVIMAGIVFLITLARELVQWQILREYVDGGETFNLSGAVIYGTFLGVLVFVGWAIAALLNFAFSKDK